MDTVEEIFEFKKFAEPENPTEARILKITRELAAKAAKAKEPVPPKPVELSPNAVDVDQLNADMQAAHDKLVMAQHEKELRKERI